MSKGCDYCNHPLYAGIKCPNCGREQPAQQQEPVPIADNTYNYAKSLAEAIFKQHFASDEHYASGRIVWGVNDTVIGILTQIDNMVADMVRRPAQQEPVALGYMNAGHVHEMQQGRLPYGYVYPKGGSGADVALYTSPPAQRTWVSLTDEEIYSVLENLQVMHHRPPTTDSRVIFALAVEAKLKEKNGL